MRPSESSTQRAECHALDLLLCGATASHIGPDHTESSHAGGNRYRRQYHQNCRVVLDRPLKPVQLVVVSWAVTFTHLLSRNMLQLNDDLADCNAEACRNIGREAPMLREFLTDSALGKALAVPLVTTILAIVLELSVVDTARLLGIP